MLKRKLDISKNNDFDPFWAQFTPGKPKALTKTNILPKTAFLQLSNSTHPRSHINYRILIKLFKKKNFFWAKNGLFKVKNRPVNEDHEVRGRASTTFLESPIQG